MTRPRFAYSTNAYSRFDVEEALRSIRGLGFDAAEVLIDTPHVVPPLPHAPARRLRELLAELQLGISNLNVNTSRSIRPVAADSDPGPTLVSADETERTYRLRYIKEGISIARKLAADCISITSGPPDPRDRGQGRKWFVEGVRALLPAVEKIHLQVGIEYEPGFLVGDLRTLREVLQDVDHPLIGANLDLGHAQVVGDDPAGAIRALRGRIWNMHVEDIRGREHRHLVPGEGEMDFAAIRRAIDETGYDRFLTVELYTCAADPAGAGAKSIAFLQELFAGEFGP